MNNIYRQKVELLLKILPFVTDEDCFAIHGGTAINLFVKNLYRLSVDIDVTYIPIEDRNTSLRRINEALMRIADRVKRRFRDVTPTQIPTLPFTSTNRDIASFLPVGLTGALGPISTRSQPPCQTTTVSE